MTQRFIGFPIRILQIVGAGLYVVIFFTFISIRGYLRPAYNRQEYEFGAALASVCEHLGGAFVKLGQFLGTRPDLLPSEMRRGLARLHRSVEPCRWEEISEHFERNGVRLPDIFQSIDRTPIGSGSIAQVHLARLRDGAQVAVKIRRPGILKVFERDVQIVRSMLAVCTKLPAFRSVPALESFDEISRISIAQLDLVREAKLMQAFRSNFGGSKTVFIPRIYDRYSGEHLIVMEYFDSLVSLSRTCLPEDQWQPMALTSLRALYQMIFTDGLVHGDLHPGNLLYNTCGGIALLDFGIAAEMSTEARMGFVDFFLGFVESDGKACANVTLKLATSVPTNLDRDSFAQDLQFLVDHHKGNKVSDFQIGQFAFDMFELQRRYGIRSTTSFLLPINSLLILEGTLKDLFPDLDFQGEARSFLFAALSGVLQWRVE